MKAKVIVHCQYFENYNVGPDGFGEVPQWKPKGGFDFVMAVDSDTMFYADTNVVVQAFQDIPPPIRQNRTPRIFFASQVDANPPTVVLFTNKSDLFDPPYLRYLLKNIRDKLAFNDVPIRLVMRGKESRLGPGDKFEDDVVVEEKYAIEPVKKARFSKSANENKGLDDVSEDVGEDVVETSAPPRITGRKGPPPKIGGPKKGVIKKAPPEKQTKAKAPPKKKKPDNKSTKGRLWKND